MKEHKKENALPGRVLRPRIAKTAALSSTQNLDDNLPTEKVPKDAPKDKPKPTASSTKRSLQKTATDISENTWSWRTPKDFKTPSIPVVNPFGLNSCNMVHRLRHASHGISQGSKLKQAVVQPYIQQLDNFRIYSTASPFDRRVTALEWHPTLPKTLAVASKSGDVVIWNYENAAKFDFNKGVGKGGSVTALSFDRDDPSGIYTSSVNGCISRQCFGESQKANRIFLNTADLSHWYCGMSVNYARNLIVAGDNFGTLTMLDRKDGKTLWTRRLHKSKVSHCEFNSRCDWLLATSSTDKTVKVWDLRMMSDRKSALYVLNHKTPINSAYFSPDSTRLLTTDQYGEIRIYTAPLWDRMERSIAHPHRFFQHLTPIKATWHPLYDLVVVGRYPDDKFPGYRQGENRSIDVLNANSGEMVCQLLDPSVSGIVSLNKFSPSGDSLASGMGYNILIWKDIVKLQQIQDENPRRNLDENSEDISGGVPRPRVPDPAPRRRRRRNHDNDEDDIGAMKKNINKKMNKRK